MHGLVGVYLKASEGHTYVDSTFADRRRAATRAGLRVGAYHFARKGSPEAEAAHFCSVVRSLERRDLRPALDAEVDPGPSWAPWARDWNTTVERRLGTLPLFYSYPAWIEAMRAGKPIGAGLWLASFGRDDGHEYPYRVPSPWRRAALHQYSSRARVSGVSGLCDVSSAPSLGPLLAHPLSGRV